MSKTNLSVQFLLRCTAAALLAAAASSAANAGDFIVYSPHVTQGRSELEFRGFGYRDGSSSLNGTRGYNFSAAYGLTSWWKPELYFASFEREPGGHTKFSGYEFENTFQLAPTGKYWADAGFLLSYEHPKGRNVPDVVEFGPLFEKTIGRFDQRLNFIWEKQVGGGASAKYEFRSAYHINYRYTSLVRPGLEAYYRPSDHARQLGPVLDGELYTSTGHELGYSAGVLFGLNHDAPNQTFVVRLEYEF